MSGRFWIVVTRWLRAARATVCDERACGREKSHETRVGFSSGYGGLDEYEYDTPMGRGRILLEDLKAQER